MHRPLDAKDIRSVSDLEKIDQYDLRTGTLVRVGHVTVHAETDKAAEGLNGRSLMYNGPTQQRIASVIQERIGKQLGLARIRLQIAGPTLGGRIPKNMKQEKKAVESVPLGEALRLGIVPAGGAVDELCRRWELANVLLRNGQIVGPSPALCAMLEHALKLLPRGARIYDPFAGTYLTRSLCRKMDMAFETTCSDVQACGRGQHGADAFVDIPKERYELLVLDPLYEQLPAFIQNVLPKLNWRYAVVQLGYISDIEWCKWMNELMSARARHKHNVPFNASYGAQVFLYERS